MRDIARVAAASLLDFASGNSVRLGVTGLSRAGKTIFIASLVHNLIHNGKLPVFRVHAEGRLARTTLQPQPDDAVPRFALESIVAALTGDRIWPDSTRAISELRLTLDFERVGGWRKGPASLTLDIVDYPGEWLLDLPLLGKSYAQWSQETWDASLAPGRQTLAQPWHDFMQAIDAQSPASEEIARGAASIFTSYLRACKADRFSLSALPPGRFLWPGEWADSPAMTFAPLRAPPELPDKTSLWAMMERRYESYKTHIVMPFFRDHFTRIDRQIVLVDLLSALNSGPEAVRDLEAALGDILGAFRPGKANLLTRLFRPRIDRILFAATKADHIHHSSHDRLEEILRLLVARAIARAQNTGAAVDVIALSALRTTREARINQRGLQLDAIIGTPLAGEQIHGDIFDGNAEVAVFPGHLPIDPHQIFRGNGLALGDGETDMRFIKFRPPVLGPDMAFPHIRMDRALEFLLGDKT
eukprot:gene13373-13488_t